MHLSDEEQDFSDESFDENLSDEEIGNKRKHKDKSTPLKKVKYEDITSEQPPKKSKNDLYKAPTVEELNELKETQNLYNNNLFRLQIEELIKEVKIKNKHQKALAAWCEDFQTFLNELPEHDVALSKIKRRKKIKSETDQFVSAIVNESIRCDQDLVVKFVRPESCESFGLSTVDALPGPMLSTSLNLKMPRSCFNVKDYLNNRYFVKRYYYLAYIAYYLGQKQIGGEVTWTRHNSNDLLPILLVKLGEKVTIRIFATPTEDYFKHSRCLADVNNVRANVFNTDISAATPTLFYNTSFAHDVTLTTNQDFIKDSLAQLPNAQEAIKLIYIWLVQRELSKGLGSFTEELILYFIAYLHKKKRINKHMSSYQILRNFWNFITETDLAENPASLGDVESDVLEKFQANFDVVFLDKTGYYNVAAFLNVDVYRKIKTECSTAFKLLDNDGINSFHNLFITKLPVELQYDLILTLKSDSDFANITDKMTDEDRTRFLGHSKLFVVRRIGEVLRRGFNKRATLIVPLLTEDTSQKISVGINLDPSHAFSILELGPALNDPKEKEFKEFWGELSTDRRFKDGSVCVAVYFKTETVKQRREIIAKITDWVVTKKLGLKYSLYYNDFEEFLVNKKVTASYPMGSNEECSLRAIAASDDLGKKLRGLEMPLSITGVQGISDSFNMTDVFPPIATSYQWGGKITSTIENNIVVNEKHVGGIFPRHVKPLECVLQLEHSSKWPKNLQTLRHMKTAFFLEVSKLLSKKHKLISSVRPDFFDIFHEGYVFRYHMYLSREVGLLKKESTNNGATIYKDTPQSKEMELKFNVLPKLVGALKGLQAQYPSYGPATALIKRWLRSQLIDNHLLSDHVVNLLSASLYVNQSAFDVPSTPQIGFLRFLKSFSELQWQIQPVIVNFNDEISKEKVTEIDSKMLQNREALPNLFIAMPYDNWESLFTKTAPSKEVLNRVKQLSRETLSHFMKIVREESPVTFKKLFIPNLDGYDLIIQLRPLLNPVRHEQVISDELEGQIVLKEFDAATSTKIPITGFNPVQCYLKELRENYGEFANFFHDSYGGNIVGVLWIPRALESRDFKVAQVGGRQFKDGQLVLNVDALIEDFYVLGKGLVKSIDKRK